MCVLRSCILLLFQYQHQQRKAFAAFFLPHIRDKLDIVTWSTMFKIVPDLLKSRSSIHYKVFQIKSVIILLSLNACLKFCAVIAGPSIQQEQELLLLEALSKRQPSYYGTSNSLMDILGRSMIIILFILWIFFFDWKIKEWKMKEKNGQTNTQPNDKWFVIIMLSNASPYTCFLFEFATTWAINK